MKIEKMNDNQIRCTLTKEDLASRHIKLSELAYGTEKAKDLFRDMMQQANYEFGFEAEDIPLMIEAIPLNADCIMLIITKVDDPEELDTRFSRFAPSIMEESEEIAENEGNIIPEDMKDLFKKIQSVRKNAPAPAENSKKGKSKKKQSTEESFTRVFCFDSMSNVIAGAKVIASHYDGLSSLYKDEKDDKYLLVLTQGKGTSDSFDRVCNIVSEYGTLDNSLSKSAGYFREHLDPIISANAVNTLSSL